MESQRASSRTRQSRAAVSAVTLLVALAVLGSGATGFAEAALSEPTGREVNREMRPVRTLVRAMRDLAGGLHATAPAQAKPRVIARLLDEARPTVVAFATPRGPKAAHRIELIALPPPTL
ncbi:MAG: hypothetical protein VYC34_05220 [Planctomycetota bacterium]|nr:hypothetical protein [Planctomycetota bacterium]